MGSSVEELAYHLWQARGRPLWDDWTDWFAAEDRLRSAQGQKFCPYCGYDKDESKFTDEHVIPQALGGNVQPTNPFLLKVCGECNSACGRWIDAPFIRSWLIYNARAGSSTIYYDAAAEPVVSLVFIGQSEEWTAQDPICDFWLGPTGDSIFHFHKPYPPAPPMVGKPPQFRKQDLDPGSVYVQVVGTHPDWHPILHRSVLKCFAGASWHYMNASPAPEIPRPWPEVPHERQGHVDWIKALPPDVMRKCNLAINVTFGDRFLVKLALGFGSTLLDPAFQTSPDAALLRSALWEKNPAERGKLGLRGRGFLDDREMAMNDAIGWKGCHVILAKVVESTLVLYVSFYGSHEAQIVVSTNPDHFRDRILEEGSVWVISPSLRRFAGPMSLTDYITEKVTKPKPVGPLLDLHDRIETAPRFPPFKKPPV